MLLNAGIYKVVMVGILQKTSSNMRHYNLGIRHIKDFVMSLLYSYINNKYIYYLDSSMVYISSQINIFFNIFYKY